ncbi:hypothetical protein DL768_002672 [Monosporascus sp. mg162]|nr:hypothetical protein DL768_002672 [Monosporascus sp. mg162]
MATVQTSNYLPDIQHLLDVQGNDDAVALEVVWTKDLKTHGHLPRYQRLGAERTVALPCGHVLGDRCVTRMFIKTPPPVTCPTCEYKMLYMPCGHFIAPALIPVNGNDPVRDRFPLTIPEGGKVPSACKECRWTMVQSKLRFVLAADKATADADRRQATLSLLVAMALSEVEDTVWYSTPATKPSGEVTRRHAAAVNSIQQSLLSWLMEARDDSRRTW